MNHLLVGGTHGNEWTGVYLLQDPDILDLTKKYSFKTLLANQRAFEERKRFVDKDLNRSFDLQSENTPEMHESKLAARILGEFKLDQFDFVIDLHSTTTNMGLTCILPERNTVLEKLLLYVQRQVKSLKIIYYGEAGDAYLTSKCKNGIVVEVGPVANNLIDPNVYLKTKELLSILMEAINDGKYSKISGQLEVYAWDQKVTYQKEDDLFLNMVHPDRQGKDFKPLQKGEPLMLGFDGEVELYMGEEEVFPIFINEAAYYNYGYSMVLTKKRIWDVD
ncbi:MAG: aspartoacylase [Bdellovibrionales bacterium]